MQVYETKIFFKDRLNAKIIPDVKFTKYIVGNTETLNSFEAHKKDVSMKIW